MAIAVGLVVAVVSGAIAVPTAAPALCGDASGDGRVTAIDALSALKIALDHGYDVAVDVETTSAPDGAVTAADALATLRAAVARTVPTCAAATERRVVVTTASCDFVSGGVAEVDIATRDVVARSPGGGVADSVVRRQGDRVFVLSRFGTNTVAELDPASLATAWQCSVGKGANPHDIVIVAPDRGYVTRYDSRMLAVIDPSAGPGGCAGFLEGTIDLSALADDDGFPEMDQMAVVGDRLFVSVQRLDRDSFFRPAGNGALAVIDVTTDTLTDVVELSIANPFTESKGLIHDQRSGLLYVGGPGRLFSDLADGGIEIVDPVALTSLGVVASGEDVGGDITDLVVVGTSRAYALVADAAFAVSVVEIDLDRRTVIGVLATSDQLFSDIELTEAGELWLADRDCFAPGLRVFSIADNRELTEAPIRPTLGPFSLDFLR